MNVFGTILVGLAMLPLGEQGDVKHTKSNQCHAVQGHTVTIKGQWNRDDSLSGPNREVGTCDKNGECITIYMDDIGKITDVEIHNGIDISSDGGDIEVNISGNQYIINY